MPDSSEEFERATEAALSRSELSSLPPSALKQLLADAIRTEVPPGRVLYRAGDEPMPGLVVSGLLRIFVTAIGGRQITVAYAGSGDLIGVGKVVDGPSQVSVQAVLDARLVRFHPAAFESVANEQPELALGIARQLRARERRLLVEIRSTAFGTVRQRVSRHLLDLAAERQRGARLVARVTQQQLAEAVGSVREVVARVLAELQKEGAIDRTRSGIVILDPERLRSEGWLDE